MKRPEMSLVLERRGRFSVTAYPGAAQCGHVGLTHFAYSCRVTSSSKYLSRQGFVIDNQAIQAYFDGRYSDARSALPSCEMIALGACHDIAQLVGKGALEVKVAISMIDGPARITATWRKP